MFKYFKKSRSMEKSIIDEIMLMAGKKAARGYNKALGINGDIFYLQTVELRLRLTALYTVQNKQIFNLVLNHLDWFDKKVWRFMFFIKKIKISLWIFRNYFKRKVKFFIFEDSENFTPPHGLHIEKVMINNVFHESNLAFFGHHDVLAVYYRLSEEVIEENGGDREILKEYIK